MKGPEANRQTKRAAAKPGTPRAEQREVCARPKSPAVSPGGGERAKGAETVVRPRKAPLEPRLVGLADAAAYCGMSTALFTRACPIPFKKFGAKRLWDRQALDAWIDHVFGASVDREQAGDTPSKNRRGLDAIRNAGATKEKRGFGPQSR